MTFTLLRIIAMLMIIAYHYVSHGQAELLNNGTWFQITFLEAYSMFGKIGVNLFVLISGYFCINKEFNFQKILKLEAKCLFFSLGFLLLYGAFGEAPLTVGEIYRAAFPVIRNEYWFMTAYIILYLLSPWYNKLLTSLTKKEYQNLLVMFIIIWSIIPCLSMHIIDGMNFNQQIWMFVTYSFGGYIKRFDLQIKKEKALLALFVLTLPISVIAAELIGTKIVIFHKYATYFRMSNTIIAFPASLLIFNAAREIKIGTSRVINFISSAAFSVYLVHENTYFSKFLWKVTCRNWNGVTLVLHSILIVVLVYCIGMIFHCVFLIVQEIISKMLEIFHLKDILLRK